jgi:transaldolase
VRAKPISLEVFADDFAEMKRQALMIAGWGDNVFVKIPVTDINGQSAAPLVRELASEGVKLNVTAILTLQQVDEIAAALNPAVDAVVSVFAGRIADTGVDPMPIMHESLAKLTHLPKAELLWASVREVINLKQAEAVGCHIVTVTHDILAKAEKMLGTDLAGLSLDTVRMFSRDAASAGYRL